MNKQELMKECNKIVLATNGGNDDYVVALCRISEAISRLDEPSLDQHDFEIRADERKKVVAELEEWVEKNKTLVVWGTNNHNNFERIKYFDLQQKLNEMKGGKDE